MVRDRGGGACGNDNIPCHHTHGGQGFTPKSKGHVLVVMTATTTATATATATTTHCHQIFVRCHFGGGMSRTNQW